MHNSTDLFDDLIGLYESPLHWARETLPDEHNADDYLDADGSYDYRAYLLDVEDACCVKFVDFDAGVAVVYHG